MSTTVNTIVIYHSGYGHTAKVAEAVAKGASAQIIAIDAEGNITDADWEALAAADAIIFGTPTYLGNVSWQFKKFTDATSPIWAQRGWQDKVFGGFTNSASPSGDKQGAMNALQTIAAQHGGIWVSLNQMPSNTKAATVDDVNYLGASAGVMARTPADASVDEMHAGDLKSATLYGARVAEIAARLRG